MVTEQMSRTPRLALARSASLTKSLVLVERGPGVPHLLQGVVGGVVIKVLVLRAQLREANICSCSSSSSDCTSSIMIVYLRPRASRKTLTAWMLGKGTRTSMGEPGWAGPLQKSSWGGQEPLSQRGGKGPARDGVSAPEFPI